MFLCLNLSASYIFVNILSKKYHFGLMFEVRQESDYCVSRVRQSQKCLQVNSENSSNFQFDWMA